MKKGNNFLLIFLTVICLIFWISSILLIEGSNQKILEEIDRLSKKIEFLEKGLEEKKEVSLIPKPQKKEIPPSIEKPQEKEMSPSIEKPIPPGSSCKIAIILDDAGYSLSKDALNLLKEGFPITVSILPGLSCSKETAEIVYKNKGEVMLHLPMEAKNNGKIKGVIGSGMDRETIKETTKKAIEDIPYCVGVNNHMGSKATADKETTEAVLSVIKEKGLYFVDSLTTPKSIAYKLSREMGLLTGKRDIFIDNDNSEKKVFSSLSQLIKIARKRGYAIGIGHIYKNSTISVLKEELPNFAKEGIELVPVSKILMQKNQL